VLGLHYGATVFILVVASVTVSIKQFGGRPIECAVGRDLAGEVVNNYCWVHATFSRYGQLPVFADSYRSDIGGSRIVSVVDGEEVTVKSEPAWQWMAERMYPGVEPFRPEAAERRHRYYQWVAGVLLLQVSS